MGALLALSGSFAGIYESGFHLLQRCSGWIISAAVKSTRTAVFQNARVSIAKSKASSRTQSPRSWQQERRTPTWIIMGHFPVLKSRFTVPAVAQTTSSAHYALCCSQIIFHEERHSLDKFTIPSPTQKIPEFLISSEWKETASQILPFSGRRVRPASTGDSLGTRDSI